MEKVKSKYKGFIAAIIVLVAVCSALTIGFISTSVVAANYSMQLENMYQKSFSELITNINNIEVDLSKILVSTGVETRGKLYDQVYTNCTYASANLSSLPINYESINATTKFINQMGGFSYYASQKLLNGEPLSDADLQSTNELYNICVYIQNILNEFVKSINYNFSILAQSGKVDGSEFSSMFGAMQSDSVKYPTLIYDGPFSESTTQKTVKGLNDVEVSKEQAMEIIEKAYANSNISNLTFEGETTGVFETYNFSFYSESKKNFYVQVTKKGGLILNVTSYGKTDKEQLSLTECKAKAKEFANNIGLDVDSVWATVLSGVAYINLTPIVGNIIIYPDMIKVKVSCSTGEVLGWEATSYAYNHVERDNLTTSISMEQARSKIEPSLSVVSERVALIPQEYGKEIVAFEFKCTLNNATYYVYIDANSGAEIQVLKVIATTRGDLLQ